MQVQHSRDGASKWVPQQAGGLFKKGNALVVEARRQIAEGEVITMDFGALPEPKLDSQVLLDYGTMDVDRGQVSFPPAMQWSAIVSQEASPKDRLSLRQLAFLLAWHSLLQGGLAVMCRAGHQAAA